MPHFMRVLSSSCILPRWDGLPESHLRERKGRYNDGSNVSINNLGKLEVLHKHDYELFGRRKRWALQHRTGWGRKVSHGRWWSLPASSASLSLTLAPSLFLYPLLCCARRQPRTLLTARWCLALSFIIISHQLSSWRHFQQFRGCKIKALRNYLNQSVESLRWILGEYKKKGSTNDCKRNQLLQFGCI